ncbi:glycosyltransferase [Rubripirellula reticaptiva]|uniref:MurG-like transferase n=1 Tax=Rubripirellula reticaptiva TaxID=2528013 RepID=A0A5C6F903_9BACT|nr:nucleotide disphospho-sugar-binding domain-containing protein [Rubripirellula reticaptiva]TWU56189.1 MurG-like transferase [Rubripirellula reticaptiva]
MRAILSAPGSRGDVNPMVAIGAALKRRGFEVVISLAEPYAKVAEDAGLIVEPVIDTARFDELLSNPAVWKPIRGARAIFREVAGDFLPRHAKVIRRHHVPGETILVSHPLDLASRIHREVDQATPLVDVHLAPSMLRTFDDPPRMTPWPFELRRPQWLLRSAYWLADKIAVDPIIASKVNQVRAEHGLAPISRVIHDWWLSPDRILAMYPQWYAPATASFAPRLVHCGFPLHDAVSGDVSGLPGNRPIVFTAGTAHHHCGKFFSAAVAACQRLDRPGLLVSTHTKNFPDRLPPQVATTGYVSFANLFPIASAVIHHGGIGTTSQCFAAGVPQIIRPMAFDQFDNTARVERLNCGRWLRNDRHLAETLDAVLRDPAIARSSHHISQRIQRDAVERAASEIHSLIFNPNATQ